MVKYKNYKLAFNPRIVEKIDESIFEWDEFTTNIDTIYFLTDNDKWFHKNNIMEYVDDYNMILVTILDNNTCKIKTIMSCDTNDRVLDEPWYEYLEENMRREDLLICNKKYPYFEESSHLKKEQESIPIGKHNVDDFLEYLEQESNL